MKNSDRTHCVTFSDAGRKYWAVKSRQYGEPIPMGIDKPEVRCAMSFKDARRMADFLMKEAVTFTNVRVHSLQMANDH